MDNTNKITTSLDFKEHREFFEKYFEYKSKAHEFLAISLTDDKHIIPTYQAIYLLLSFTNNYISNVETLRQEMNNIKKMIYKDKVLAVEQLDNLLNKISKAHEESELLPKKKTEQKQSENIWRKQEDLIMREITKGCADIIFGNGD